MLRKAVDFQIMDMTAIMRAIPRNRSNKNGCDDIGSHGDGYSIMGASIIDVTVCHISSCCGDARSSGTLLLACTFKTTVYLLRLNIHVSNTMHTAAIYKMVRATDNSSRARYLRKFM